MYIIKGLAHRTYMTQGVIQGGVWVCVRVLSDRGAKRLRGPRPRFYFRRFAWNASCSAEAEPEASSAYPGRVLRPRRCGRGGGACFYSTPTQAPPWSEAPRPVGCPLLAGCLGGRVPSRGRGYIMPMACSRRVLPVARATIARRAFWLSRVVVSETTGGGGENPQLRHPPPLLRVARPQQRCALL